MDKPQSQDQNAHDPSDSTSSKLPSDVSEPILNDGPITIIQPPGASSISPNNYGSLPTVPPLISNIRQVPPTSMTLPQSSSMNPLVNCEKQPPPEPLTSNDSASAQNFIQPIIPQPTHIGFKPQFSNNYDIPFQGPFGNFGTTANTTLPITTQPTSINNQPQCFQSNDYALQELGDTKPISSATSPIIIQPSPIGISSTFPLSENNKEPLLGPTEGWMLPPPDIPVNCPPGLEYLTTIDHLFIKQKVELLEAFTGFETNNKYTIKNINGDKVYYVAENNDCCNRCCFGSLRSFELRVLDKTSTEIIQISRDFRCDSCLFPCCLQEVNVYAPPGNFVGSIAQTWSIFQPKYDIRNETGNTVLKIEGPFCVCECCCNIDFQVLSNNKKAVVGKISKQWSGLARELFTEADNFGISFPRDLDVRIKAVMIGACFLIDFMYFEQTSQMEPWNTLTSIGECGNLCVAGDCCNFCDCENCCECGDCCNCDDCGCDDCGCDDCGCDDCGCDDCNDCEGGGDCGDCGDCGD